MRCPYSGHHTEARVMPCKQVTDLFTDDFVMLSFTVQMKPSVHDPAFDSLHETTIKIRCKEIYTSDLKFRFTDEMRISLDDALDH